MNRVSTRRWQDHHAFCRLQWYVEKGIDVSMVATGLFLHLRTLSLDCGVAIWQSTRAAEVVDAFLRVVFDAPNLLAVAPELRSTHHHMLFHRAGDKITVA